MTRLFQLPPLAARPNSPQVSAEVSAPAIVRRGSWTIAFPLRFTLRTTSSSRVPPPERTPLSSSDLTREALFAPEKHTSSTQSRAGCWPSFIRSGARFRGRDRGLVVLLDERGDELDDRPDLEVRLGRERARLRRRVWVGRPRLDRRLGHQRLQECAGRRCDRVRTQPCGKSTWCSSRGSHSRL